MSDSPLTNAHRRIRAASRRPRCRSLHRAALLSCVLSLGAAGCSDNKNDPLEPMNRFFLGFNDVIDAVVGKPVTSVYTAVVPKPVQDGLHNTFENIGTLNVMANSFFQGKVDQGFSDAGRFLVNSTIGIGGVFDPATDMGFAKNEEDFGKTLAAWGFDQGVYLVLPLLGPTSTRDVWAVPVAIGTNPLFYFNFGIALIVVGGFDAIDSRARADEKLKALEEAALDRYTFLREAYLANREFKMRDKDGDAPIEDDIYEDFEIDEPEKAAPEQAPQEESADGAEKPPLPAPPN